jgi:hypothetical protein
MMPPDDAAPIAASWAARAVARSIDLPRITLPQVSCHLIAYYQLYKIELAVQEWCSYKISWLY